MKWCGNQLLVSQEQATLQAGLIVAGKSQYAAVVQLFLQTPCFNSSFVPCSLRKFILLDYDSSLISQAPFDQETFEQTSITQSDSMAHSHNIFTPSTKLSTHSLSYTLNAELESVHELSVRSNCKAKAQMHLAVRNGED